MVKARRYDRLLRAPDRYDLGRLFKAFETDPQALQASTGELDCGLSDSERAEVSEITSRAVINDDRGDRRDP